MAPIGYGAIILRMAGFKFFFLLTVVFAETCDDKKKEKEDKWKHDSNTDVDIPSDFCLPPERVGFYGSGKLTYLEDCPDLGSLYPGLPLPASTYNKVPSLSVSFPAKNYVSLFFLDEGGNPPVSMLPNVRRVLGG